MTVSVPSELFALANANLAEAHRIAATLSGVTTLEALNAAEQAVKRQPTKADLTLAIRGLAKQAREERRAALQADPFHIPGVAL